MNSNKCDSLKNELINCKNHIYNLSKLSYSKESVLQWFQVLCDSLIDVIQTISKMKEDSTDEFNSQTCQGLLLFFTQLISILSLLINSLVFEETRKLRIDEARNCVKKQLLFCLDGIGNCIIEKQSPVEIKSGSFLNLMNETLDRISDICYLDDKTEIEQTWKRTQKLNEEFLCTAMSIAQISLKEDSTIIRGTSQIVLEAFINLTKEIHKNCPNASMMEILGDNCIDKLLKLEKRVNLSVLRLCLHTFSKFSEPIDVMKHFCFDQNNKCLEDFDNIVVEFDLHVDRIMQIGLFAISCSNNTARCIKIKSCLASLEALETELVPSFAAVLNNNTLSTKSYATLLYDYWINQTNTLIQLIYCTIDPMAFSQTVFEESQQIFEEMKEEKSLQRNTAKILNNVSVLRQFLEISQNEFTELEKENIKTHISNLYLIYSEVEKSLKIIAESDQNYELRIMKRCKIMLNLIKKLWYNFAKGRNDREAELRRDSEGKDNVENEDLVQNNGLLKHLIKRGGEIIQERSVLYKTPMRKTEKNSTKTSEISQLCRNKHSESSRNIAFKNTTTNCSSFDLTGILRDMTDLSITLGKV